MWHLFVLLLIGGGLFLIFAFVAHQQNKGEVAKADRALTAVPNFRPALTQSTGYGKPSISIDPASDRFAIVAPNQPPKVFHFDQLVAVEVERDGQSITKTNRGSQIAGAAAGALLLGPAGLLLGGLTGSKRQEATIKRITLKLYTNDLVHPIVDFPFLSGLAGHKADGIVVSAAAKSADEWYGRFQAILHGRMTRTLVPAVAAPEPVIGAADAERARAAECERAKERAADLLARIEHGRLRRGAEQTIRPRV